MDDRQFELEVKKYRQSWFATFLSILTPLILVYLTFTVQSVLKEREAQFERQAQILNEKQNSYATLGVDLNIIYVYLADVGDFREYTPLEVIQRKREADRLFFIFRPYWSEETEERYTKFMDDAFETYSGSGKRARIRASADQKVAAYRVDGKLWNQEWDQYFTGKRADSYRNSYYELVASLLSDTTSSDVRKEAP